ncbi:Leucine-rich repeat (LRR) family protein [Striga hermonthica]|uniref:Leucine-rich repeat (LRR) family protein n=1 Tax=Striga hermonthica TaxID=68872 RepID=A0A9N7MV67_STRHE|nr:Leucine-rich repeat (LRR) family protein [Striga hermonthica]
MEISLVRMCIDSATQSADAVEKWRRQRRTIERLPSPLADALLRRLLRRRLLFPSLLEVFKYSAEEVDLRGESCVDAEWMAYLGAFRYLRSINLADCHRITNSAIWSLSGLTYLKEVDLARCYKVTDAGIRHLLSVPTIEKLCISQTGVTSDGVRMLASLTNLMILDLGGLPVTDSALRSLEVLMKLQHLELWGSEVSNIGAAVLKKFPDLSFLNLAWTNITDLPILPSLSTLNMSNCSIHSLFKGGQKVCLEKVMFSEATFTDVSEVFQHVETSKLYSLDISSPSIKSFGFLSSMKALTYLNLSDSALVDNSVEHVACIGAKLRYLNLSNTKVSSDGIGALAGHVPNLETLLLSGTPINDKAIIYISMMPSLKVINLNKTNVKGLLHQEDGDRDEVPSFSALENLNQLERLDLEMVNIKDNAVWPLTKLQRLRHLSLQSFSLTDVSLHHISSSTKLTHLGIRDAVLTDGGLLSFIPPQALRVLDITGSWLMTRDAVMHFCRKYPQIEVRHGLVERVEKRNFDHLSPSRANVTGGLRSKHKLGKQSVLSISGDNFLDQRLKYSREELVALQFASGASTSQLNLLS